MRFYRRCRSSCIPFASSLAAYFSAYGRKECSWQSSDRRDRVRKNYFWHRFWGFGGCSPSMKNLLFFPIGVVPRAFGSRRRVRLRELVRAETVRGADSTQQNTFESDQTAGLLFLLLTFLVRQEKCIKA